MPRNPDNPNPDKGPQWKNPDRACPKCGQARPNPGRCTANKRGTRPPERCENDCELGWKVCRLHGAKVGYTPANSRYGRAFQSTPEMVAAYQEIMAAGGIDEHDLTDELLLQRVRLNAALNAGDVDAGAINKMLSELIRAIQKNQELRIKEQGLVQRSDAEKLLRAAVRALIPYVPDSLRGRAFEDIAAILARGNGVLQGEQVIDSEGHEVVEEEKVEALKALPSAKEKRQRGLVADLEAAQDA